MVEILLRKHLEERGSSSWSIVEILLVAVNCTFVAWLAQYHWKKRKLYMCASKIHGPPSYPFIGSGHLFFGDPYKIFCNIMKIFDTYPGLVKVWFGNRLFFGIYLPEHLDIVMNSPLALAKERLYKYAEPVAGHGLFTAPVPIWKRHRKLIMPTFNQRILDQFVEVFAEQSEILAENLQKYSENDELDLFHIINKCTLNIICETAMGVKTKSQTVTSEFGLWVDKLLEIIFLRMFVIWYHFDFIFNWTSLKKVQDDYIAKLHSFTGKIVKEKRTAYEKKMTEANKHSVHDESDAPKRKAFLDLLIELSYEGAKLTDKELMEEVITFTIAGSDTTASSNCFVFTMLGMHQDIQDQVYKEIIDIIGPTRMIEHSDLPNLKYTEMVIKETLRLFPVGAFIVRLIEGDIDLGDHILPKNSSVVIGILKAHRNVDYWPDPLKFDPNRFLPEEVAKRHPSTYLPFSMGPRTCIGPKYAMMAMKTVVTSVVRKYKIFTSYKSVEEIKLKTHVVVRPRDGFKVSIKLRN